MPLMIWLAAIVEGAIQNYVDMSILLFIQFANASIGYYEITKAGDAVPYPFLSCPLHPCHPDLPPSFPPSLPGRGPEEISEAHGHRE